MSAPADEWEQLLATNPKVLWGLVADVVKAVKAGEGERRTGRRPAVSVGSLDELYNILFAPCYARLPFPQALVQLLVDSGNTQRSLAEGLFVNQATVSRMLAAKSAPPVEMIERISEVLKVRPTYFLEYRALKIGQLVTEVLLADPQLSADAVRRLFGANA